MRQLLKLEGAEQPVPTRDGLWKGQGFGTRGSRTCMNLSRGHSDMERGRAQTPCSSSSVSPAVLMLDQAYPGTLPVLPVRGARAGAILCHVPPRVLPHVLSPTHCCYHFLPPMVGGAQRPHFSSYFKAGASTGLQRRTEAPGGPHSLTVTSVFSFPGRVKLWFWNFLQTTSTSKITRCFIYF